MRASTGAVRRRHLHRRVLPPGVPRAHAAARELPLLRHRAQAEAAAFRPCLKCRPEIAPGLSAMDSSRSWPTRRRAGSNMRCMPAGLSMPAWPARLGVTDRHLRRIFQAAHGVSPHAYLTTQRLLLAKQLLTDTPQPVTQVALASGFDSLRRFNAAFAERYRLPDAAAQGATAPRRQRRRPAAPGLPAALRRGRGSAGLLRARQRARHRAGRGPDAAPHAGLDAPGQRLGLAGLPLRARAPRGARAAAPSLAPVLGAVLQAVRQGWTWTPTRRASTRCWPGARPLRPARACPAHGRLRAGGARDPGPAGHGEGRAHAGAAPGAALRHARSTPRFPA
jgi:methylphosphotriester-DNA--protein-cysteine methyltransferase